MSEENREPKQEIEKLTDQEFMALELNKERIVSAETSLQLRRTELQILVDRIVRRAEENGKYTVVGLDPAKGITRVLAKVE